MFRWGEGAAASAAAATEGEQQDDDNDATTPPLLLIRWYGEHSCSWVPDRDVVAPLADDYDRRAALLHAHGRRSGGGRMAVAALKDADGAAASASAADEAARVRKLTRVRALEKIEQARQHRKYLSRKRRLAAAAAVAKASKATTMAKTTTTTAKPRAAAPPPPPPQERWSVKEEQRRQREALNPYAPPGGPTLDQLSKAERAAGVGSVWAKCPCCGDDDTDVACGRCGAAQHLLCSLPPVLGRAYVCEEDRWRCSSCGGENRGLGAAAEQDAKPIVAASMAARVRRALLPLLPVVAAAEAGDSGCALAPAAAPAAAAPTAAAADPAPAAPATAAPAPTTTEESRKDGLTPAWLIATLAYKVFGLQPPTSARPFIAGLLDPCTNSKIAPNVPAEVCYDKRDDGLAPSNSWQRVEYAYVNPEFGQTVQWRFVNRCADEVEAWRGGGERASPAEEDGASPASPSSSPTADRRLKAIALLTRNSTDTSFFQRLRAYPRVYLRRSAVLFRDYGGKHPIGFGCVIFLLSPLAAPWTPGLIERFFEQMAPHGEPGVGVDLEMVRSPAFLPLLARLGGEAARHHRDHWARCGACGRWRVVEHGVAALLRAQGAGARWTCAELGRRRGRPVGGGSAAAGPPPSCRTPLSRAEAAMMAGGGGKDEGEDDDEDERQRRWEQEVPRPAKGAGAGHDWRRRAVVKEVVAAIFARVRRRHGGEGGQRGAEEEDDDGPLRLPLSLPVPRRAAAPARPPPQSEYNDSDEDVPLDQLRQHLQQRDAERERQEVEIERQELLAHLRPGMPAAQLLAPLAWASEAARSEREAAAALAEEGGEEGGGRRLASARRERAARLADLYLAASLAARELREKEQEAKQEDDEQREAAAVDAVARALLPGCPVELCRAVLSPSGPAAEMRHALAARVAGAALATLPAALSFPMPLLQARDLTQLPSAAAQVACLAEFEARTGPTPELVAELEAGERRRERERQQRREQRAMDAAEERRRGAGAREPLPTTMLEDSSSSSSDDDDDGAAATATPLLDPLELARLARAAANHAVLAGLGLRPTAIEGGGSGVGGGDRSATTALLPAVSPRDALLPLASRRLAARAAAERLRRRAETARRELEARARARRRVLRRCRDELCVAAAEEEAARDRLERAERRMEEGVARMVVEEEEARRDVNANG
jgi:hypothetical protein